MKHQYDKRTRVCKRCGQHVGDEDAATVTCEPRGVPPDPEDMNDERAEWAQAAIDGFLKSHRGDEDMAVSDLLCNLGHYCDRAGINMVEALSFARGNYNEETGGKGTQLDTLSSVFIILKGGLVKEVKSDDERLLVTLIDQDLPDFDATERKRIVEENTKNLKRCETLHSVY